MAIIAWLRTVTSCLDRKQPPSRRCDAAKGRFGVILFRQYMGRRDGQIGEGDRNSSLTSLAGVARRKGMGLWAVEAFASTGQRASLTVGTIHTMGGL